MRRAWALAVPVVLVAGAGGGVAWHSSGDLHLRSCQRVQGEQLDRFQAELEQAVREAMVRERQTQCSVGVDAQLVARVPGTVGRAGLRDLTAAFDRAGWTRTIGLERRAPESPDYVMFRFTGTGPVPERPIDILVQEVGYRGDPLDD